MAPVWPHAQAPSRLDAETLLPVLALRAFVEDPPFEAETIVLDFRGAGSAD
jgi:hypothetical protein